MAPLAKAMNLRTLTIFGGVRPNPQIQGLRNGVDIVIACPGRLADHVQSGHCDLGSIEITVLDEADHMADLGFLPVVRRLLDKTPQHGQRMLFSATLDAGVDVLVKRFLHNPVTHSVDSAQSPVANMTHHVLHVSKEGRVPVLADLTAAPGKTIVFTRTKHGAKALARQLNARGVPAVELHGNLSQNARDPQPHRVRHRHGQDAGRHRHRGPRHPRRRRQPGRARRPAGRAQGLPAPLGPHRPRRRRGHRRHADARRAGERRTRPDPQGRHQADHHPHPARRRAAHPDRTRRADLRRRGRPAQGRAGPSEHRRCPWRQRWRRQPSSRRQRWRWCPEEQHRRWRRSSPAGQVRGAAGGGNHSASSFSSARRGR